MSSAARRPASFDARARDDARDAHAWASEDEGDASDDGRRGRSKKRLNRRDSLDAVYAGRRSASRRSEYEAEDEAIEITRAELEKLREKIDQARSEAGYSSSSARSSRRGSRASSRHSSRGPRGGSMLASTESVDPDFADERSTQDGSSVAVAPAAMLDVDVYGAANDLLNALGGDTETPKIWDDEDLDDEATKKRQGAHHIGSAVVPQKVVERYDKARKDYEAALKAKKDKKDRLRREAAEAAAAKKGDTSSSVDALANEFRRAISFARDDDERKVRQRMDYKNTAVYRKRAARLANAKPPPPTFFERLSGALFGCCMHR